MKSDFSSNICIVSICICLLISSCANQKIKKAVRHIQGKELIMDGCLYQVTSDSIVEAEDSVAFAPVTLVSYIDEKLCTGCLTNYLSASISFVNSFKTDSVKFICVAYPRPIPELYEAIKGFGREQIMVYYDKDNLFYKNNFVGLLNDNAPRSFLVNGAGKVIYVGDPVTAMPISDLYKKRINQLLSGEIQF